MFQGRHICGILGLVSHEPVNQPLYDGLQMLQHRGQSMAGIVMAEGSVSHIHKGRGVVHEVFRTRSMRDLIGNAGIAHVRYSTADSTSSSAEAQSFYVSSPFSIILAHNGSLADTAELHKNVCYKHLHHINASPDSEMLLSVLARELRQKVSKNTDNHLTVDNILNTMTQVCRLVSGTYGVATMTMGYGMVAFHDPHGIYPLVLGTRDGGGDRKAYTVASESAAFNALEFGSERGIAPGKAVSISFDGRFFSRQYNDRHTFSPCLLEYVHFTRLDSVIGGVSVYQARMNTGAALAEKIRRELSVGDIDVVMSISGTSRPSTMELTVHLNKPYHEGLIKNHYTDCTFIMPGQATRRKLMRQKLSPMETRFQGKSVLLVDDPIVYGMTSRKIVEVVRTAGARKVYITSAAPEVRYPNVYGIDMPIREEPIVNGRSAEEIVVGTGADGIMFQNLDDLEHMMKKLNPCIRSFNSSCFSDVYQTGDIDEAYLARLSAEESDCGGLEMYPSKMEHNISVSGTVDEE